MSQGSCQNPNHGPVVPMCTWIIRYDLITIYCQAIEYYTIKTKSIYGTMYEIKKRIWISTFLASNTIFNW